MTKTAKKTAHDLATEIAATLFTSGDFKQKAKCLVLEMESKKDAGGWCESAVIAVIETKLEENLFWSLS